MPYSIRTKDGIVIRNIPDDVKPDDPSIMQRVEAARADPNLKYRQMQKVEPVNPTEGMSGYGKFMAGAGKSVSDLGLGARQIAGLAPQSEVDEVKQRDAPLMDTGAGITGNIAGNVGMAVIPGLGLAGAGKAAAMPGLAAAGKYALSSPATLGGIATQGGLGALQSGLQPVATGESRVGNTALGFAGGAAIPAVGMALKAGKAVVEPTYQSGREAIMGRTLRRVAGDQSDDAMKALQGAKELVPGSVPTAGQAANNPGIAALERAAFAVEPSVTNPVEQRLMSQNEARISALKGLVPKSRQSLVGSREGTAGKFYQKAMKEGVDPEMAKVLQPQIKNLMERLPKSGMHGTVATKAKELARLNGVELTDETSLQGLHWMKLAVDDLLSSGGESRLGRETTKGLMQFKNDLLTVMGELSPSYDKGRLAYIAKSKPINQLDTATEIFNKSKSFQKGTDTLTPAAFARALRDETAQTATGFDKATLKNTFSPKQMSALNAIKEDLGRAQFAQNAGRGVGSDTVQKMAYTNLMEQSGFSGLPNLLSRPVQLAEYVSRAAYSSADKEMRRQLAEALLDPKRTAELMKAGIPSETARRLGMALRSGLSPVGRGGTPALLDAR